mmetsp:Transcript_1866/g.4232  ORF Transcript_1866/g.4232 Transcript_1866/m.4232 type:complete len:289 (-) Transcript_1866:303-1169(-)
MESSTSTSSTTSSPQSQKLGIVFDIDGTLIGESEHIHQWRLRPRTIEFLQWLLDRGHRFALWTAAYDSWAITNAYRICQRVHGPHEGCWQDESRGYRECHKTFCFAWGGSRQRERKEIPLKHQATVTYCAPGDSCIWCGPYSHSCTRCYCAYYTWDCPCRKVKELRKVWNNKDLLPQEAQDHFRMERCLIVENTPQQCIMNYSNAIYVPTYHGYETESDREPIFDRLKHLIIELEQAENVRHVRKCSHPIGPHACFYQSWRQCEPISAGGSKRESSSIVEATLQQCDR